MLAQSVERPPHNREVVGSIPGRVIPKDVKRWELLLPSLFGVQHLKGIEQRRSGAAQWLPGPRSIGQKDFPFRTIKSLLLLLLCMVSFLYSRQGFNLDSYRVGLSVLTCEHKHTFTGWPRKNATILIVNFKDIINKTELIFILLCEKFIFKQNDTMIINFG